MHIFSFLSSSTLRRYGFIAWLAVFFCHKIFSPIWGILVQQMQDFDILREIGSVQLIKTKPFELKKDKSIAVLGMIILVGSLCCKCAPLTRHSLEK